MRKFSRPEKLRASSQGESAIYSNLSKAALLSAQRCSNLVAEFLSVHMGCELDRVRGTRLDGRRWLLLHAAVVV